MTEKNVHEEILLAGKKQLSASDTITLNKEASTSAAEIRGTPLTVSNKQKLSEEEFIFWFANKKRKSQLCHVISFGLEVMGETSEHHLEAAIRKTVQSAPILQSRIADDGLTAYRCQDGQHAALAIVDLPSCLSTGATPALFDALLRRPLDIGCAPQIEIFRTRRERAVIYVFRVPHLSFDGQSVNLFLTNVVDQYCALVTNAPLAATSDLTDFRRPPVYPEQVEIDTAYFVEQVSGARALSLARFNRNDDQVSWTNTQNSRFPRSLSEGLRRFAKAHNTSLFTVVAAVTVLMLSRYLGEEDVIIGLPISLRERSTRNAMGCMVKTVPVKVRGISELTFEQLVLSVRNGVVDSQCHKSASLLEIARAIGRSGDGNPNVLWTAVIASQGQTKLETKSGNTVFKPLYLGHEATENELMFDVREIGEEVEIDCHFRTDLFPEGYIRRMIVNLMAIGGEVVDHPHKRTSELLLIDPQERQLVEQSWSGRNRMPNEPSLLIEDIFAEVVRHHGEAIALEHGRDMYTYDCLDRLTNRTARLLIAEGCTSAKPVILLSQNPAQALIFMWACIKAGITYVPIDCATPDARIRLILQESSASHILTDSQQSDWPQHRVVSSSNARLENYIDAKLEIHIPSAYPAYIIFTSGSTGTPKGVAIRRESIPRVIFSPEALDIRPSDRVMQLCSRAFDVSVAEIYGTLLKGATLILLDDRQRQRVDVVADTVSASRISILISPTNIFNELVLRFLPNLVNLRRIFFIGEKASVAHVRKAVDALSNTQLINAYGPTEATVFATIYYVQIPGEDEKDIPVGTPIPGQMILVLDRFGRPCPIDVEGEIHIGGAVLMNGYWKRDDLTALCMIQDIISNSVDEGLLYKSGDFGYWDENGMLHVTGRKDSQRKIRGFRVELDEVRRAIIETGCVDDAFVRIENGTSRVELVAYLKQSHVTGQSSLMPDTAHLETCLRKILPEYMIPIRYSLVDNWSITVNGKLDETRIIQQYSKSSSEASVSQTQSSLTGNELRLATIWKNILYIPEPDVKSDFFQLGGNSLSAIDLCVAINIEFDISIDFYVVYDHSNFSDQIYKIEQAIASSPVVGHALKTGMNI